MSQFSQYDRPSLNSIFPPVIKFLMITNIIVYVLEKMLLPFFSIGNLNMAALFSNIFALQPLHFDALFNHVASFYPWQVITYQYMHGDLGHIFFNLFALWMFGSEIERLWGSKRFLVYYTLCGIGAALVQMATMPEAPTVGASGSIYGIMIAFAFTFPSRPIFMFPIFIPIPAKYFIMIMMGIDLFSGLTGSGSMTAHFAHLGGAAAGFLLLRFGTNLKVFNGQGFGGRTDENNNFYAASKKPSANVFKVNWQVKQHQDPPVMHKQRSINIQGEEVNQSIIDQILDKINSTGFQSLTERERNILNELSKKL